MQKAAGEAATLSDGGREMHADLSVVSGNGWLKLLILYE